MLVDPKIITTISVQNSTGGGSMIIKLKEIREKAGYSTRELAAISKTTSATISRIENAQAIPSVYLICRLALALNVSLNDLVDMEEFERIYGK